MTQTEIQYWRHKMLSCATDAERLKNSAAYPVAPGPDCQKLSELATTVEAALDAVRHHLFAMQEA